MITIDDLKTALLDLLYRLDNSDIDLIIGGGYGIYLKCEHIRKSSKRTLLSALPDVRSTVDLDLFLLPELLVHSTLLKPLKESLDALGYEPIETAKFYHFALPGPVGAEKSGIKIDLLTGPMSCFSGTTVKVDSRRAKPSPPMDLHAHPTDEAQTLEKGLVSIHIEGRLSLGQVYKGSVFLPHPFTFLMMKLFAFRDRKDDVNKEYGRYHALDIYTILATTTEEEWNYALELRDQLKNNPYFLETRNIVKDNFSSLNKLGMLRLRESPYYKSDLQLEDFMSALQEIFPL